MKESILVKIQKISAEFNVALLTIDTQEKLDTIKNQYMGKNGFLTIITEEFKNSSIEEKKLIGSALVDVKKNINALLLEKKSIIFIRM